MNPVPTSQIVLGTSSLGERPDAPALAAALVRSPIGDIDTSNMYAGGRSERFLGGALATIGGLPEGKRIFSKADRDLATGVFDGDRVRRSLEESLERLGLTSLPLYQLHDPDTISFDDAMGPNGAVPALLALRDQGVIGAIGIAAGTIGQVHRYVATGAFDAVLSHNRFTLVDRTAEPTFRLARELGMTVFNAAPFGGGTLANGRPEYGYRPMSEDFTAHLGRLRALAEDSGIDLAAAAIHLSMRSPLVDAVVVGVSSLARLSALNDLRDAEIDDAFYDEIDRLGPPPPSGTD